MKEDLELILKPLAAVFCALVMINAGSEASQRSFERVKQRDLIAAFTAKSPTTTIDNQTYRIVSNTDDSKQCTQVTGYPIANANEEAGSQVKKPVLTARICEPSA